MSVNTGRKVYKYLVRVNNATDKIPLDVNGIPTSISGLPQDKKLNHSSNADYVEPINSADCPQ